VALRRRDSSGRATREIVSAHGPPAETGDDRPLLVPLIRGGGIVADASLDEARKHHAESRAELPVSAVQLSRGEPAIPTVFEEERR
ncbi:MAG TPA: nicotinate phosphoribosyltransferase, partial [Acidothermales bacterium]